MGLVCIVRISVFLNRSLYPSGRKLSDEERVRTLFPLGSDCSGSFRILRQVLNGHIKKI